MVPGTASRNCLRRLAESGNGILTRLFDGRRQHLRRTGAQWVVYRQPTLPFFKPTEQWRGDFRPLFMQEATPTRWLPWQEHC